MMQHGHTVRRRTVATLLLALLFGARVASAGSISIQWDANSEADVVGYRVYIGTLSGVYSSSVDVGNTTTYLFNSALAGQKYCFAVAAYFAGPRLGDKSVEVCNDTSGNQPPTLADPGDQSHAVGAPLTLTLNGSDPEGSPVTFSATGLPTGLTLNTSTGFISGTPTAVGTYNTQATVSDGSLSMTHAFTWTISASLPGVATPLRPSGTLATATPAFEWESVTTATSYRLWVDDASTTDPKIQLDLTPAQAGCTTAGAVCRVSPGVALQAGRGSWSVRASNTSGAGPWSGAMDFTVPDTKVPVVAITAPTSATTMTTSAATIALAGTATDDAGVTQVTWTNNLGGSGTAAGTTSWSVASLPLKVGPNIITVTARDAGGNFATDVLTVTKTDAQAPALTIVSPAAAYPTTSVTLAANGTASDDDGVTQVTWASDRGGSGVATGTTAWSIAGIALKPGANVIAVTAHDAANNKTTKTVTATLTDGEAPTVAIGTPAAVSTFATTSPTTALGGTASDNVAVAKVTWTNSKGGSGVAVGTTAWTVASVALQPGSNVITVTAQDAAGNAGTDVLTVTVTDTVAPAVSIAAPTSSDTHTTAAATLTLGGSASDAFGVTDVRWTNNRGGSGVATGTTSWSAVVALQAGVNVLTVTASDAAGNTSTDRLSVTYDAKAPVLAIAAPAAATVTKDATVSLSGTASDDIGVTEVSWSNDRGGSGRASGTTAWSVAGAALQSGLNVITVVARDAAGNRTSATVSVTRDSQAPAVGIVLPTQAGSFVTNKAALALAGQATDDAKVTQVTWQNSRGGGGTAAGTSEWTVPAVTLLAGANVITVTARDAAGNAGTATLTVTLDTRAPVVSITTPTGAAAYQTSEPGVIVGGAAGDDVALAEVTWTNSTGGSGAAGGTSAWSTPRIALKPGLNTITVTARDTAGNVASATLAVRATDIKAPAVRILRPSSDPSFSTSAGVINLEGQAADDFGVARVSWVSDRGGNGVAKGAERWIAGGLTLQPGVNVVTVTATDGAGNSSTDVVRISYERGLPTIALTSPTTAATYATSSPNVALTGVASDDSGIARVKWSTDKGQVGDAVGTTAWSIPAVTVALGTTNVTVTAYDNSGNQSSLTLAIVYADTSKPTVKIYTPTTAGSMTTAASGVTLGGTATDNVGVTQVKWATDRGTSGTAFGGTSWSTPALPLPAGTTVITITALDAAGNAGEAVFTVTSTAKTTSGPASPTPVPTATSTTSSNLSAETTSSSGSGYDGGPSAQTPVSSQSTSRQTSAPSAPATSSSTPSAPSAGREQSASSTQQDRQPSKDEAPAVPPVVRIALPTAAARFNTTSAVLTVAGVATHASGISVVRWSTSQGDSGVAEGTSRWTIPGLAIKPGTTVITVTAAAVAGGDMTNAVLTVVRPDPLPKLSVTAPTADSQWTTGTGTVALRGTASDNVTQVTWSADSGATGVATGTTAWAIPAIALRQGVNRITLAAQDAKGRTDRQVLTIRYRPGSRSSALAATAASGSAAGLE